MSGRKPKVTAALWIETAKRALIDEGVAGVKVDRLAQRLGVTRGGFYHNFEDRDDLLAALLHHWEEVCRFTPPDPPTGPAAAVLWLDRAVAWMIDEQEYDPRFDMAVREWGRSDPRTAWAVEREDRQRLSTLRSLFELFGYSAEESEIRARVFYYHQIGYYALNVKQTAAERKRTSHIYMNILCGQDRIEQARKDLSA